MNGNNTRLREQRASLPVYPQLPLVPARAAGCDIITDDGRHILDLYGGHAVTALGYSHPRLTAAIQRQAGELLFQSNVVALDVRARAAERLVSVAPESLTRCFFVNSGAEANENALRMAIKSTRRNKVLAITHGFHGRTAAAAAVSWNSGRWYGFPDKPFDVEFIPRDDIEAARAMIDESVAAVIFEPVQGLAGAYDLQLEFVQALRQFTKDCGAMLIADEVQCGIGRSGRYFASEAYGIEPDLLTSAKALGGGIPCGAVLSGERLASECEYGDLGTTFGGGPVACAAMLAVLETVAADDLLKNVRNREIDIREHCVTGPVRKIQGMGLLLGLVCDRPATIVRDLLLDHDIMTGTSSDPHVLRILAPLIIESQHVRRLAAALSTIAPADS